MAPPDRASSPSTPALGSHAQAGSAHPRAAAPDPRQNRLLAALPDSDLQSLRPHLEPVVLKQGQVLYESGAVMTHGYFPTTAVVSLQFVTEAGASAEIAVVGMEGMVGTPLFMGGGSTPSRALVQSAGHAYRISGPAIRMAFAQSAPVMRILLRFTQALIAQMAQLAVCNRHHRLDQQLCRWLLLNLDRTAGGDLAATQEQIANMLGVRREGVTEAARALQLAELISYHRGHIEVLDRPGLERRTCECYAVIKSEYDRLLPDDSAP